MESVGNTDTKNWRTATGRNREVMRQCEWFRAALEHHCREGGRGTQAALSAEVNYKYQSMVSNLLKGIRTADFKQAVKIALYFKMDLIAFLQEGRELCERASTQRRRVGR